MLQQFDDDPRNYANANLQQVLRMKRQGLLTGLPLRRMRVVT
jgi:hypothetical protein